MDEPQLDREALVRPLREIGEHLPQRGLQDVAAPPRNLLPAIAVAAHREGVKRSAMSRLELDLVRLVNDDLALGGFLSRRRGGDLASEREIL